VRTRSFQAIRGVGLKNGSVIIAAPTRPFVATLPTPDSGTFCPLPDTYGAGAR